jgi:hypothetical protein
MLVYLNQPLSIVLKYVALLNQVENGLSKKAYDFLRKIIIEVIKLSSNKN